MAAHALPLAEHSSEWKSQSPDPHTIAPVGRLALPRTASDVTARNMVCMYPLDVGARWLAPLRSILAGSCVFFLGSLSHIWLRHQSASLSIAFVDGALVGVGAGILVLFYERRQRLSIMRKREVIRMMNHHVRNSLQVISLAVSVPQREEDVNKVRDAVDQIDWALREVLPGQREDLSHLSFHRSPQSLT